MVLDAGIGIFLSPALKQRLHFLAPDHGCAAGYAIDSKRVSKVHAVVAVSVATRTVRLVDRSSNGTYVNNKKVGKGNEVLLRYAVFFFFFRDYVLPPNGSVSEEPAHTTLLR